MKQRKVKTKRMELIIQQMIIKYLNKELEDMFEPPIISEKCYDFARFVDIEPNKAHWFIGEHSTTAVIRVLNPFIEKYDGVMWSLEAKTRNDGSIIPVIQVTISRTIETKFKYAKS